MTAFTAQDAKTMGWEQVVIFWRNRQIANRDAGLPFYEKLVDPITGKVMATVNDPR